MRKVDENDIPIFDLTVLPIDGEISREANGFDKIAFVDNPAIEEMGVYLSSEDKRIVVTPEMEVIIIDYLKENGMSVNDIPSNWEERTEEEYNKVASETTVLQLTSDPTARESWNDISDPTGEGQWLVRYQYEGPNDNRNRPFCSDVINLGRIYTEEEIKNGLSNPQFGNYSIWDYKGSYGCRHRWQRKIYFESYEEDTVTRSFLTPGFVTSRLNDSDATKYNSQLSAHFKLQNSEKQQVVAPLLIPDKKIYREDKDGDYFIRFSSEVIAQIRAKADKEGKLKDLNIMKDTHKGDIVQAFIIDEWLIQDENDKAYTEYGFDKERVPVGSWMVITQVIDREFWEKEIKQNKKFAYSIEAFLNMKLVNLKINKNNKGMEKEKDVNLGLPEGRHEIDGKIYVVDAKGAVTEVIEKEEAPVVEVEAEDKKDEKEEMASEDKKEEEEKAPVVEVEAEDKKDEEVKAEEKEVIEKEEIKAEEKVEEKVEEIEAQEDVAEEGSENKEDSMEEKFEALYEEIAELKAAIAELGTQTEKVEMSSDKKSSLTNSLKSLSEIYRKSNKFS